MALAGKSVSMASGDRLKATKAWAGAAWGAAVGFIAPGVTYLLTVDGNGITGQEWLHAGLISLAFAAGGAIGAGGTVFAVENKPKTATTIPDQRQL